MSDSILSAVRDAARETPERPAILEKRLGRWRSLSIGEIADSAASFAAGIRSRSIGSGDTVVLLLHDRSESVVLDLAVMASGAVALNLDPATPVTELAALLSTAQPKLVVVQGQHEADRVLALVDDGRLAGLTSLVYVDPAGVAEYDHAMLAPIAELQASADLDILSATSPDAPAAAVVDHTHASRMVLHSHRSLLSGSRATIEAFSLDSSDRVVAARGIADPGERSLTVYPALLAGARLAIPESRSTLRMAIHEVAPTYIHVSTRFLTELAGSLIVRFAENRRLKKLTTRALSRSAGVSLQSYGSGARLGGLGRLSIGRPALEKIGLDKARHIAVSGPSTPPEILDFFRSLGGNPSLLTTAPSVAGPIAVNGRAIPAVTVSDGGRIVVEGAQVAGDEPIETSLVGSVQSGTVTIEGHTLGLPAQGGGTVPVETLERTIQASPLVASATVVAAAEEPTVVIELSRAPVARWVQQNRLVATTYRSFASLPELNAQMTSVVQQAASAHGVTAPTVMLTPTPLTDVAGALGPGATPRRDVVVQLTS